MIKKNQCILRKLRTIAVNKVNYIWQSSENTILHLIPWKSSPSFPHVHIEVKNSQFISVIYAQNMTHDLEHISKKKTSWELQGVIADADLRRFVSEVTGP